MEVAARPSSVRHLFAWAVGIAWGLALRGVAGVASFSAFAAPRLSAASRFAALYVCTHSTRIFSVYCRKHIDACVPASAPSTGARRPFRRYLVAVVTLVAAAIFFAQAQLVGRIDLFATTVDSSTAALPPLPPPVALPVLDDPVELVPPASAFSSTPRRAVAIAAPTPAAWPFARTAFTYVPAVRPNSTFYVFISSGSGGGSGTARADAQGAFALHSRLVELGYTSVMSGWSAEGHAGWPPFAAAPLEGTWTDARAAMRPGDFVLAPLAHLSPAGTSATNASSVGPLGYGVRGAAVLASPPSTADAVAAIPSPFASIPMSWGLASAAQSLAWAPLVRPLLSSVYRAAGYEQECFDVPPRQPGGVDSVNSSVARCISQARDRHEVRIDAKSGQAVLMFGSAVSPELAGGLAEKGVSISAVSGDGSGGGVRRATMSRASVLVDSQSTSPASLAAVASLFDVIPLVDARPAVEHGSLRTGPSVQPAPADVADPAPPAVLVPRDYGFASVEAWVNVSNSENLRARIEATLSGYPELAANSPLRAEALQWRLDFSGLVHMYASSAAILFRTRVPPGSDGAAFRQLVSIATHFPLAAVEVVAEDEAAWHAAMRGRWHLLGPTANFVHVVAAASASPSVSATRTQTPSRTASRSSTRSPSQTPTQQPSPSPSPLAETPSASPTATVPSLSDAPVPEFQSAPSAGAPSAGVAAGLGLEATRPEAGAPIAVGATTEAAVASAPPSPSPAAAAASMAEAGAVANATVSAAQPAAAGAAADPSVAPTPAAASPAAAASSAPARGDPVVDASDKREGAVPGPPAGRRLLSAPGAPPPPPHRKGTKGVPLAKVSLSRSWQAAAAAARGDPALFAAPRPGAPPQPRPAPRPRPPAAPAASAYHPAAPPRRSKKSGSRGASPVASATSALSRELCASARLVVELSPDVILLSHELVNAAAEAVAGLPGGPLAGAAPGAALSPEQVAQSGAALLQRPSLWTAKGSEAVDEKGSESVFMATYPAHHARCLDPLRRLGKPPSRQQQSSGVATFGGSDALRLLRGSLVASPTALWAQGGLGPEASPADVAAVLRSSARLALGGVAAVEDDGGGDGGAGHAAVARVLAAVDAWERHVSYPEPHWALLRAWRGAFEG